MNKDVSVRLQLDMLTCVDCKHSFSIFVILVNGEYGSYEAISQREVDYCPFCGKDMTKKCINHGV